MRTLAVTQNITLDGRIDMLGDWFDDQGTSRDLDDVMEENRRQREASDALLVGRETFEAFRGYWRDLDDDRSGVSAHLNRVAKHVVSSTLEDPDWAGTTVIGLDDVAGLKEQDGADIVCTGSVTLTHALLRAGLVDELRLFAYPVVQGEGRHLFPDGLRRPWTQLLSSQVMRSGVVVSRWSLGAPAAG